MSEETQQGAESAEVMLEKLRVEKLQLQRGLEKDTREKAKLVNERRDSLFAAQLRRELATVGIQFHPDDAELRQAMELKGFTFVVRNDGGFTIEREGKALPFKEALEAFAVQCPYMLQDRRQIAHLQQRENAASLSKSDLRTIEQKNAFIAEFGVSAFEKLPMTSVPDPTLESLTADTWRRMSTTQKVKLGLSESQISRLLKNGRL